MESKDRLFNSMAEAIVTGNKDEAETLARRALSEKFDPNEIIEKGYIPGIQKAGILWEMGEYFLPELISSAECMKAAISVLKPVLEASQAERFSRGKIVIGTIEGDIHDIGKNLVASMLSANGFDVLDLGADVKIEKFIIKAQEMNADLICLSALLTTTMLNQRRLIEMLKERGLRQRFKVLVGGAPVTQRWASDIGADGYGENALEAVRLAKEIGPKRGLS